MHAVAGIGHNQASPFDLSSEEVEGLLMEASHWLTGKPVATQADADGVSKILAALREADKTADAARKAEKAPWDAGAEAVQERWKPLLTRIETASQVCKDALTPFLEREDALKREAAEAARRIADAKLLAAQQAFQTTAVTDLAAREKAEAMLEDANAANRFANRQEQSKAAANGGARAVTLRTTYRPVISNPREAARHYWIERYSECQEFFLSLAAADVRAGKQQIPGFDVIEEKTAV